MIELTAAGDSDFLKMQRRTLTGEAKWRDIEDLINRWARRDPAAAIDLEKYIKSVQADLTDRKHGRSKSEALGRIGIAINPTLMEYIKAFYPDFMDTKDDMHEFMKRFPKFRVPSAA